MLMDYDHTTVKAPYLVLVEHRPNRASLWHFRGLQPNVDSIPGDTAHSIEHFLIHYLRKTHDQFVIAGLMGCMTGYYLVAVDLSNFDQMSDLVAGALTAATEADAVPLADEVHCGQFRNHDLPGAQDLARRLLDQRAEWGSPGPDAQLIAPDAA